MMNSYSRLAVIFAFYPSLCIAMKSDMVMMWLHRRRQNQHPPFISL